MIEEPILFWNKVALEAVAADHTGSPARKEQGGPTPTARALAIVHLAMADAFAWLKGGFTPYNQNLLEAPPLGSSWAAAIGEAARITLSELYKNQTARFDAAMTEYRKTLIDQPSEIDRGLRFGNTVGQTILLLRGNDGSGNNPPYKAPAGVGLHEPDPLHPNQGFLTPNWGKVKTFGIGDVTKFRSPAPAALNSSLYRDNFNDVKEKGVKSGGTRTAEETLIGLYWAYDGPQKLGTPPRLYNQIARVIAVQRHNTITENARLFALLNVAMADAGIQCWESKYHYNLWRPVIGVRKGGLDGNPETTGDPTWEPLGAPATNPLPGETNFTPGFPAYPSGHATFGAAAFDTIRRFYDKDAIAFDFISEELDGRSIDADGSVRPLHSRHFDTLTEAIEENARSRVFLGVHWQIDADAGVKAGEDIAKQIFENHLRPVH